MIKAPETVNGDAAPTQRARKTSTLILSVLSHPSYQKVIQEKTAGLSGAVLNMLEIVIETMRQGRGTDEGVMVWQSINRAAIAEALDKPALIPYDIVKLHKLAAAGLLVETVENNPRGLGGSEFVYSVPPDLLPALVEYFDPHAFSARRMALAAQTERAAAERAERLRQDPELALVEKHRFEHFETTRYFYRWDFEKNKHIRRRKTLYDRLWGVLSGLWQW